MKPFLAVTSRHREQTTFWDAKQPMFTLAEHYVDALRDAGAVPLLLAHPDPEDVEAILDVVAGVVLTGGGDISPQLYDAPNTGLSQETNARADASEAALVSAARRRRLPTLGICRGMQLLNVALGGTMHQHIRTEAPGPHGPEPTGDYEAIKRQGHPIRLEPDSRLSRLYGRTERWVNTYHHQAVDRLGEGLRAVAFAPDGIVEAVEYNGDWDCLGVQWHPERTADRGDQILFDAFLAGVATHAERSAA